MNILKNLLSLNDDERLLAEVRTYQEKLIAMLKNRYGKESG